MDATSAPQIRPGREADVAAVIELWGRSEASTSSTETAEDVGGLLLRDPEALLLVELEDGTLAGSLIVGWDGWRGGFYRIVVDPAHRRKGFATALVRAGEERLRALGARRLNAIVESHEPHAMAFWTAAGFEAQTSRTRFVKNLP